MIAAELMTEDPRTVRPTDLLSDALEVLQTMEIRHLPVVDDDSTLVGMLSDRDVAPLMRPVSEGLPDAERLAFERPVADLMSSHVVSVEADTDMATIIDTLLEHRIGAVPVVDADGFLIGIVSYVDILRAVGRESEPEAPTARGKTRHRRATT